MRMDGVAIVLANEDDRQPLQRREVQAFVEDTFLDRSVAHETHHDGVRPAIFHGVGIAHCLRDRGADDGRSDQHIVRDVDQMH